MVIALLILIVLLLCFIAYQVGKQLPAILEALEELLKAQLSLRSHQSSITQRRSAILPRRERNRVSQAYAEELELLGGRQVQGLRIVRKGGNVGDATGS